jgi:hypothetical protein
VQAMASKGLPSVSPQTGSSRARVGELIADARLDEVGDDTALRIVQ